MSNTSLSCSLGIEQEFQVVDTFTGNLFPGVPRLLNKGLPCLGTKLQQESKQCCIELVSAVCADIPAARKELATLNGQLKQLVEQEHFALISAGTHPEARWQEQKVTEDEHYLRLEQEFQDLERSLVIYGLHIHVGVDDRELSIVLLNQLRTWLPHLLALSANSPFYAGRHTGLQSFRTALWKMIPRTGLPDILPSWYAYEHYLADLIENGSIENGKEICWDLRPHPVYPTLEFRICDMPLTSQETLALAALCQALVTKLRWLQQHNLNVPILPREYLEENKWRAMRYGLDAEVIDVSQHRRLPMRAALHELLDFIDDVVDDLGSRQEIQYLRSSIDDPAGNGADRQIACYQQTDDIHQVTRFLVDTTMGALIPPSSSRKKVK